MGVAQIAIIVLTVASVVVAVREGVLMIVESFRHPRK
jgi:hypothetical protein